MGRCRRDGKSRTTSSSCLGADLVEVVGGALHARVRRTPVRRRVDEVPFDACARAGGVKPTAVRGRLNALRGGHIQAEMFSWRLALGMLWVGCLGCFPDLGPGAADSAADNCVHDSETALDGGPLDGGALDGAAEAAVDVCGLPRWIDPEAFGEHHGRTTVLRVDRTETFPLTLRPTPSGCEPDAPGAAVAAVRYTARSNAWLHVESAFSQAVDHLWVATGCEAGADVLACEGRLRRTPAGALVVGPLRSSRPLRRGEVVWIFLASVPGDGELMITEVPEVIPLEGLCDPSEIPGVCAAGTSCVTSGATARCVADGREGARCRSDFSCDAPLRCVRGEGARSTARCVSVAPDGQWCGDLGREHPVFCAEGTCVDNRCRRDGVFRGACRPGEPLCDGDMVCAGRSPWGPGVCLRRAAPGGSCGDIDAACSEGQSCRYGMTGPGRCEPRGTEGNACREQGMRCDDGLYCSEDVSRWDWSGECVRMPLPPRRCGPGNEGCPAGQACFTAGEVTWCAPGIPRGHPCRAEPGGCIPGLSCHRSVGAPRGGCSDEAPLRPELQPCGASRQVCPRGWHCQDETTCLEDIGEGGPCASNAPRCAADLRCVQMGPRVNVNVCRAPGTSEGWCRDGVPACDAGLRCVVEYGGAVCQPTLPAGGPCESLFDLVTPPSTFCPAGTWCDTAGSSWQCAVPGALGGPCRAPSSCDAGLRCDDGVCVMPAAAGAVCDALRRCPTGHWCAATETRGEFRCAAPGEDRGPCRADEPSCDGGARCLVGWTHQLAPRVDRLTLTARESFPIVAHCEARPDAPRVVCGYSDLNERFYPRSLCPADRACTGTFTAPTCAPAGARGQFCRLNAPRCDAGLACSLSTCALRLASGSPGCTFASLFERDAARCIYPLACGYDRRTEARCAESPLRIEVSSGAEVPSTCGDSPQAATPLRFQIVGVEFEVTLNDAGEVTARPSGAPPSSAEFWLSPRGNSPEPRDDFSRSRCGRVVGDAPRRRVVFMIGPDRVTVHEGAGGVEISYGAGTALTGAGAPVVVSPALRVRSEVGPSYQVIADDTVVTPGTVVRFLPR